MYFNFSLSISIFPSDASYFHSRVSRAESNANPRWLRKFPRGWFLRSQFEQTIPFEQFKIGFPFCFISTCGAALTGNLPVVSVDIVPNRMAPKQKYRVQVRCDAPKFSEETKSFSVASPLRGEAFRVFVFSFWCSNFFLFFRAPLC